MSVKQTVKDTFTLIIQFNSVRLLLPKWLLHKTI